MSKIKEKYRRKVPEGLLSVDEPVFKTDPITEYDLSYAYYWYGTNYTVVDAKEWLLLYLRNNNVDTSTIDKVVADNRTPMVACSIARLLNRSITLPERSINYLNRYLTAAPISTQSQSRSTVYRKITTADDKNDQIIAVIENEVDQLLRGNDSNFSLYKTSKVENLSKANIRAVFNKVIPRYLQMKAASYKDHYSSFTKKEYEKLANFYTNIIVDCEKIITVPRNTKKPRKVKEKSVEKILKDLKYKKQDDTYKITSIDPSRVLKATTLVTFNTKYRYLMLYFAEENKTLSVKGTTIINYDTTKSLRKKLRKPQDDLNKVLVGTTASISRNFNAIKATAEALTSGRVNDDTIILRAA